MISLTGFVEGSYLNRIALGTFIYTIPRIAIAEVPKYSAQAEFENYLLQRPDYIQWQFYLFNRMQEEGLSYWEYAKLKKLVYCESNWKINALNPNDVGSPSYGLFQWKEDSFKYYKNKYNLWDDLEDSEVLNIIYFPEYQIPLTIKVIQEEKGWMNWKNCWEKI